MKRLISVFLAVFMLACTLYAEISMAAPGVDISYDAKGGELKISGSSNAPTFILTAVKGNGELSSLSDGNPPAAFEAIGTVGGSFSSSVIMPDTAKSGRYTVYLTGDSTLNFKWSFVHLNTLWATPSFDAKIKGNVSDEAFKAAVSVDSDAAAFGFDTMDAFYISNKADIIDVLCAIRQTNYTKPYELYNDYYKAYALAKSQGSEKAAIDELFEVYKKQIGISLASYTATLDTEANAAFYKLIKNSTFKTSLKGKSLAELFREYEILSKIQTAQNGGEINTLIESTYKMNFDMMRAGNFHYGKILTNNKYKIYNKMNEYSFNSFSDIATHFATACKWVYDNQGTAGGGGGGMSSGGSTGGSSGGMSGGEITIPNTPVPKPELDNSLSDTGVPILPENASAYFSDVSQTDWSYTAVASLSKLGIINGYTDGSFKPNNNISRAEFTKLVFKAFKNAFPELDNEEAKIAVFSDVKASDWFYNDIIDAAEAGIIQGNDGKFNPNDSIKREDTAVIIYNAIKKMGTQITGVPIFDDRGSISLYAYTAVGALSDYSIMKGYDNMIRPLDSITRAEAAQLIYNAVQYFQNKE